MGEPLVAAPPLVFQSRGIFYFPGRVRSPLAGIGRRGDFESNRLVLDDADTEVTVDPRSSRITLRNDRRYPRKTIIGDLMFLAEGTTVQGGKTAFSIHLKVFKSGDTISLDLHRHMRTQDHVVSATFEPFEVVVTDGQRSQTVLNKARTEALISEPSLVLRIVKSLMAMRNNLETVKQRPDETGFRIADLSVGFGTLGFEWMLVRAQLESLRAENAPLIRQGSVVNMLREGAWEMKLTAFSEKWLPEVVKRDLFLFGLDELPLLADVRQRGLRKGQTMSFRFERGSGEVLLDGRSAPFEGASDVARAYLEFHMLGGLLAESAESVSRSHRS